MKTMIYVQQRKHLITSIMFIVLADFYIFFFALNDSMKSVQLKRFVLHGNSKKKIGQMTLTIIPWTFRFLLPQRHQNLVTSTLMWLFLYPDQESYCIWILYLYWAVIVTTLPYHAQGIWKKSYEDKNRFACSYILSYLFFCSINP